MNDSVVVVILAAGKGTRFELKDRNKVTLRLGGKPIILYSVELFEKLGIGDIFIVVGFAKESIKQTLVGHHVTYIEQKEQIGTADALASVIHHISPGAKHILVINGDDPFHKEEAVISLMRVQEQIGAAITFSTSELENPKGMGRILRDNKGGLIAIIEEKDATEEQRKIKEVNGACYLFTRAFLNKYLPKLKKSTATGEYYLTDLIGVAIKNGEKVETLSVEHKWKNINTPDDLREAEELAIS